MRAKLMRAAPSITVVREGGVSLSGEIKVVKPETPGLDSGWADTATTHPRGAGRVGSWH